MLEPAADGAGMEEKIQRVGAWLKKIYGNEPVPQYEVNESTVDILYQLAECNEARDKDVSLLIEDMKQKAKEYEAKANHLQGILRESLGLSLSNLSVKGISCLNALVNSAMTLETKDTSLTSFFCAINDMTSELYTTELKNREMDLELTNIRKKLTVALLLQERLEEDLKKTEERLELAQVKADSRSHKLNFLKDKSEDLKIRIKAAEEQLIATGLDQSLTHESLMSLSEKVAGQQEELAQLKKNLEYYLDLPPSLSLARVKIEEVKREVDILDAEFSKEVEMLTLEMPEPSKCHFK
ncbi:HAUS augmin-like complex subunit 1 [Opisthocomus hoazin]|uniref:HAUS augmin-like complex subunit 1 n=1 Tax=Opisthocomus hoazin TaxID=30419 RepID=UPI003F53861A